MIAPDAVARHQVIAPVVALYIMRGERATELKDKTTRITKKRTYEPAESGNPTTMYAGQKRPIEASIVWKKKTPPGHIINFQILVVKMIDSVQ